MRFMKIFFVIALLIMSPTFAGSADTVRIPLQDEKIPKLDSVFVVHEVKFGKDHIGYLFEVGGGDPAMNGNFLYLLYLNETKAPPYENIRQIYLIDEVLYLNHISVKNKNRVCLSVTYSKLSEEKVDSEPAKLFINIDSEKSKILVDKRVD